MLTKRLIACFDIRDKMVTKAHKFQNNIDIDKAEVIAKKIYADQIDEIIFFDILASAERRKIDIDTVKMIILYRQCCSLSFQRECAFPIVTFYNVVTPLTFVRRQVVGTGFQYELRS